MSLNSEQRAAVEHKDGPALLVAGPGAGKTTTLTEKYAYLLRSGVRPDEILCLTFSTDAAREMRRRIAAITGYTQKTLEKSVSTFHSLGYRIVLNEKQFLGFDLCERPVLTSGHDKKILRDIVSKDAVYAAKAFISRMRRSLVSPEESYGYDDPQLADAYAAYDATLREEGVLDFDSMVYYAVEILSSNPEALARWQARAKYVIVDEAHDTSYDQLSLAKLLTPKTGNLTAIFDLSQSIYSFRGADPKLILDESGGKRFFLSTNYRSGEKIIEAFKPFGETDDLSAGLLSRIRSGREVSGELAIYEFGDEYQQAREVVNEIVQREPSECAVLARTKAVLFPYCEILEERGISYSWRGSNFWQSQEILDAIAFARFALDQSDCDSFVRICTSQYGKAKFIGRTFAIALVAEARRRGTSPASVASLEGWPENKNWTWESVREELAGLRKMRGTLASNFLRELQVLAGVSVYESQNPDDFGSENLSALVRRAERFGSLEEFVSHAKKMTRTRTKAAQGVTLSTVHASKGLEFTNVFVVGVSQDIFPHIKSNNYDEERRIAYVALSRAKDFLWVSSHGKPSVFMNMLPVQVEDPPEIGIGAQP